MNGRDVLRCLVLQDEGAFRAEAKRGNHRLRAQLRFVVAVKTDTVPIVRVIVEQHAVECRSRRRLDASLDVAQQRRPGQRLEANPGIGVVAAGIAIPSGEARLRHLAAPHHDLFGSPRNFGDQPPEGLAVGLGEREASEIPNLAVRHGHALRADFGDNRFGHAQPTHAMPNASENHRA